MSDNTPVNDCRRKGRVSIWVGSFPSVEAAEEYFGIPDEIGVCLPATGFAADLGLDEVPTEFLEVNFEQLEPRSVRELLADASFSASFIELAVEAARVQGIQVAQGIALLYDFDYAAHGGACQTASPLRFVGAFPFVGSSATDLPPRRDPRLEVRNIMDDLL